MKPLQHAVETCSGEYRSPSRYSCTLIRWLDACSTKAHHASLVRLGSSGSGGASASRGDPSEIELNEIFSNRQECAAAQVTSAAPRLPPMCRLLFGLRRSGYRKCRNEGRIVYDVERTRSIRCVPLTALIHHVLPVSGLRRENS